MADAAVLRKHPCPECGGDAVWDPSKQALGCPYCGHVFAWTPGEQVLGETIKEHDLTAALRDIPDSERGWQEAKRTVQCQSCRAIMVFDAARAAQNCEFCGSPSIIDHEAAKDAVTPESLLPFKLSEAQTRDRLRAWYGSHWLAPDKLKKAAMTDTLHGIYVPYWTFDSHVDAAWTAESGFHYYETEQFRDAQGNLQSRQVQRTRWEPSAGELQHFFDDELIPGTVGVNMEYLRKAEPFPTAELKHYDPAFVRGWVVERYQIDLRQAAESNLQQMEAAVTSMCAAQVPGDTQRNLQVNSRYQGRTFKHILVPIWLVTYTFGSRTYQIVVNGFTGAIAGGRPTSWVKVFFYIILPILIFLVIFVALQR